MLYPVELRAQLVTAPPKPGRGGEIRTPDILLPKQARYQAALHPGGAGLYALSGVPVNARRRPFPVWVMIELRWTLISDIKASFLNPGRPKWLQIYAAH